jgi:hypothetical protein
MCRLNKVNCEGFHLVKKLLVDEISNSILFHDLVIPFWLVQSHAQRGTRSPTLREENPDDRLVLPVLEKFLNFFVSLCCNLEHSRLLDVVLN